VSIYKLFLKEAAALENIYEGAKTMFQDIPQIKRVDGDLLPKLERIANGLEEDNTVSVDEFGGEILSTVGAHDDNLNSISHFGTFDDEASGSETDTASSGGDDNQEAREQEDFLSIILGMGASHPAFNTEQTTHYSVSPSSHSFNPFGNDDQTINNVNNPPFNNSGDYPKFQNSGNPFGGNVSTKEPKSNPFGMVFDDHATEDHFPFSQSNPYGLQSPSQSPNPFTGGGYGNPSQNPFLSGNTSSSRTGSLGSNQQQNPFASNSGLSKSQTFENTNPFSGSGTSSPFNTSTDPFGGGQLSKSQTLQNPNPFISSGGSTNNQNPFATSPSFNPFI
jgi:hypothetical protein